jgi:AAA domain/DnaB-like helicase N terminal domain
MKQEATIDLNAEKIVLGHCLRDRGKSLKECIKLGITPNAFYYDSNVIIFKALLNLRKTKLEINETALIEELTESRKLQEAGDVARIYALRPLADEHEDLDYNVQSLLKLSKIRNLCLVKDNLSNALESIDEINPDFILKKTQQMLIDVSKSNLDLTPKPHLTIYSPNQIINHQIPEGHSLLGEAFLEKGEITTLIGQGGIGKSRLSIKLALSQITGKSWCNIETKGDPQIWLMMGNENSVNRLKTDLNKMLSSYSAAERELIEQKFKLQVPLSMEDYAMNFDEESSRQRFVDAISEYNPGVLVIDPFANYVLGDENNNADVINTIKEVRNLVKGVNPNCSILFIHHSRTGAGNISQGVGYNANFARGAKGLYSACRCQINLMPGDPNDSSKLVLSCGKSNNCEPFQSRGIIFDSETFDYKVDPKFNIEEWLENLESGGRDQACTIDEVVEVVKSGVHKSAEILEAVMDSTGCSRATACRRLKEACEQQILQASQPRGTYTLGNKYVAEPLVFNNIKY